MRFRHASLLAGVKVALLTATAQTNTENTNTGNRVASAEHVAWTHCTQESPTRKNVSGHAGHDLSCKEQQCVGPTLQKPWEIYEAYLQWYYGLFGVKGVPSWVGLIVDAAQCVVFILIPLACCAGCDCAFYVFKMYLVSVIVGLVVSYIVAPTLLYPVLAYFEVFHMERAILFCLPMGNGPDVAFSVYVFVPSVALTLSTLKDSWKTMRTGVMLLAPYNMPVIGDMPLSNAQKFLAQEVWNVSVCWGLCIHLCSGGFGLVAALAIYILIAQVVEVVILARTDAVLRNCNEIQFQNAERIFLMCQDAPQFALTFFLFVTHILDARQSHINQYEFYALGSAMGDIIFQTSRNIGTVSVDDENSGLMVEVASVNEEQVELSLQSLQA